jgi:hypothetical protein
MIRHIRSVSMDIRNMVSYFIVLLHLMRVTFGELDEFLTIVVHPYVMLVSHLIANAIFDVRSSCIQVCTPCILKFFFFNSFLLLLERLSVV